MKCEECGKPLSTEKRVEALEQRVENLESTIERFREVLLRLSHKVDKTGDE